MSEATFWNGEPCEARKVTLLVSDAFHKSYWARPFIGTRRRATEVTYHGDVMYLDDEDFEGSGDEPGWRKVTLGRGLPQYRHRNLYPAEGTVIGIEVANPDFYGRDPSQLPDGEWETIKRRRAQGREDDGSYGY